MAKRSARVSIAVLISLTTHSLELRAATDASSPDKAATKELIRKLGSEDFAEREAATKQLKDNALKSWPIILRLIRVEDPDLRMRVRGVVIDKAGVLWTKLGELEQSEDAFMKAFAGKAKIAALRRLIVNWRAECNKKLLAVEKDHKTKSKTLRGNEAEAFDKKCWTEKSILRTQCNQFDHLLKTERYAALDLTTYPRTWDPKLLPVADRRRLRVSFYFINTELPDALAFVGKMTGLTYEVSEASLEAGADRRCINLRVSDMDVKLAMNWICRLANLKVKDDPKNPERIILGK